MHFKQPCNVHGDSFTPPQTVDNGISYLSFHCRRAPSYYKVNICMYTCGYDAWLNTILHFVTSYFCPGSVLSFQHPGVIKKNLLVAMIESGAVVYVPAISDCMPVYSMQGTKAGTCILKQSLTTLLISLRNSIHVYIQCKQNFGWGGFEKMYLEAFSTDPLT